MPHLAPLGVARPLLLKSPLTPCPPSAAAEHVRKLKGGKPGQVLLAREDRVVVVRPHDSLAALAGER
jgi:hypothetical protein